MFDNFGVDFLVFFRGLGNSFCNFRCLGHKLEIDMYFPGGTGSTAGLVAVVNHMEFWAFKAPQALTADLQPAASGRMTAEKRLAWTDDC